MARLWGRGGGALDGDAELGRGHHPHPPRPRGAGWVPREQERERRPDAGRKRPSPGFAIAEPSLAPGTSGSPVPWSHPANSSAALAAGALWASPDPAENDSQGWTPATLGSSPSRAGSSPGSCGWDTAYPSDPSGSFWPLRSTSKDSGERPWSLHSVAGRLAHSHWAPKGGSPGPWKPGWAPLVGVLTQKLPQGAGPGGLVQGQASHPSPSLVLPAQAPPRGSDTWP